MSSSGYPAPVRDDPQSPPFGQSDFTARIDAKTLSLDDIELPGLGEPGEGCGADRMASEKTMCPNFDAVRYEPLRCRRVECPDCYTSEERERAFEVSVRIEGTARILEDRPHAVAWSPHPDESQYYSIEDINRMMRTGRRHSKEMGVTGGYSFVHGARLEKGPKARLVTHGYGSGGAHGELGSWMGVRHDALELGDWREYAKYEPHGHSIGFPEFIDSHEGDGSFIVEKYGTLDDVEEVVNHVEYLMHHRMTFRGDGQFTGVRPWGSMHHASNAYIDVEVELGPEAYAQLCREVAAELGGAWSPDEGLHYPDEGARECPECGAPLGHFLDLWDIPKLRKTSWQGGQEFWNSLTEGQRDFIDDVSDLLYNALDPTIRLGDIDHPEEIAVWVDDDRPPPD